MENILFEYINDNNMKIKINDNFNKLSYKKKLSYVKKDAEILSYMDKNQIKQSIKSPIWGQIINISIDEENLCCEITIEKCKHDMLYFNICSHCSFNNKLLNT